MKMTGYKNIKKSLIQGLFNIISPFSYYVYYEIIPDLKNYYI